MFNDCFKNQRSYLPDSGGNRTTVRGEHQYALHICFFQTIAKVSFNAKVPTYFPSLTNRNFLSYTGAFKKPNPFKECDFASRF